MSMTSNVSAAYNVSMHQQPRKQKLLETAFLLFNQQGYHATGIDQILAVSGVAKATLYKYFESKEALILEVLKRRHLEIAGMVTKALQTSNGDVLSLFDAYHQWFQQPDFYGCNFIQASIEYSEPDHPLHRCAADHKNWLKQQMIEQLIDLSPQQAETWASQCSILLDGAIVAAQVRGEHNAAREARQIAKQLLDTVRTTSKSKENKRKCI